MYRTPVNATDEELLTLAQNEGAPGAAKDAANRLLERYERRVYLWCFRYVREHERALDLSQDVLLAAYQGLAGFQGRSAFSSWVFTIVRNRCVNELKRVSLVVDDSVETDQLRANGPGPDRAVEEAESETRLLEMLNQSLEPEERRAIWLHCVERMPVDEVTTVLGLQSRSGARAVLQRARRKLRTALAMDDELPGEVV